VQATYHGEVTILFCDIKGFTSLSNQLHPGQIMLFLVGKVACVM
jgi:class 3 adenylate cyclase